MFGWSKKEQQQVEKNAQAYRDELKKMKEDAMQEFKIIPGYPVEEDEVRWGVFYGVPTCVEVNKELYYARVLCEQNEKLLKNSKEQE